MNRLFPLFFLPSLCFGQTTYHFDDSVIFSAENRVRISEEIKRETLFDLTESSGCKVRMVSVKRFESMYKGKPSAALANTLYDTKTKNCLITFNRFYFLDFEVRKFTDTLIHEIVAHVYNLGHVNNPKSILHMEAGMNQKLLEEDKEIIKIIYQQRKEQ